MTDSDKSLYRKQMFRRVPLLPFFLLSAWFCALAPVFAQEESAKTRQDFFTARQLVFRTFTGIWAGQTEELVYQDNLSNEYLSQLLWNIMPLPVLGFSLELSPRELAASYGLVSSFSLQTVLPSDYSLMQDRDWVTSAQDANGELTNFSEHTNKIRAALRLDLLAGFNIPVKKKFALRPHVRLLYQYFSFAAQDGYREYKSSNWDRAEVYGEIITFTQIFTAISGGIAVYYPISGAVSIKLLAEGGKALFYYDEDNHARRNLQFIDSAAAGYTILTELVLGFFPRGRLGFDVGFFYNYISGIRGNTVINDSAAGTSVTYPNISGAILSIFGAHISLCLRL